jgi:hypothetical protein
MDMDENLCKRIKSINKNIYIITIIPYDDPDLIIKAFKSGSDDILNDSFNYEELYRKVSKLLKIENKNKVNIRRYHRVSANFIVKYKIGAAFLRALSENIGVEGISIKILYPPPVKSKIEMEFTLPERKEEIRVTGEVIWVEEGREILKSVGIKFIKLSERDRKLISDFIKEVSK